jgi:type IV pilus assembly protein PilV
MKHQQRMKSRRHFAGVSMVEALVALVVISVGMLGIAGLYLSSLQAGRSANLRVQALNLASELADKIRSNRKGRDRYNLAAADTPAVQACVSATCTAAQIAENDLALWRASINGTQGAFRNLLNANGTVTYTDNPFPMPNRYDITITWRESGSDADSSYRLVLEL